MLEFMIELFMVLALGVIVLRLIALKENEGNQRRNRAMEFRKTLREVK